MKKIIVRSAELNNIEMDLSLESDDFLIREVLASAPGAITFYLKDGAAVKADSELGRRIVETLYFAK